MKNLSAATILVVSSVAISLPAFADEQDANIWELFQGAPKVKDADGNYWKLRGRVYWDGASLSETPTGGVENTFNDSEFRAVRMGVEGKYSNFKYKAELDFAGGETVVKGLNVKWQGEGPWGGEDQIFVKVGQMKAGPSMEEENSSRHTTFIERGMITDAIGFDRRIGVSVGKSGDNYFLSAGAFGNSINGAIDDNPSNTVLTLRGTYAPILEDRRIIHVGGFLRHTKSARGAPKRSARWGPHLATQRITPVIGDDALLIGLDAATVMGSFHAHGEFVKEDGDSGSVDGGFIQAGYFLTGETRKYKGGSGKFDRTKALHPLSKGGYGGFEIAARFDTLDARNAGDGKVDAWTLGLNWYPESHLRVSINYTDASGDRFSGKGIYTRLQVDW